MISTITPFGAIGESEVKFLVTMRAKFYLVDNIANKWEISESTFKDLISRGFQNKEDYLNGN